MVWRSLNWSADVELKWIMKYYEKDIAFIDDVRAAMCAFILRMQ
jgi:hypothetical protein